MDLTQYRGSPAEQARATDLLRLIPQSGTHALDIGARDGHFSLLMTGRFDEITALDLVAPTITHPKIKCVQGNASQLPFLDCSFDFVFCAEVLEHIPAGILRKVCSEIERVADGTILIGVPYMQDLRFGRTTCRSCGGTNPPWGHINAFDERSLIDLFPSCEVHDISFVGTTFLRSNFLSTVLMDFAGNPYGTYGQEEGCIHCGQPLLQPGPRSLVQRVATKLGFWSQKTSSVLSKPHANWLHAVFRRRPTRPLPPEHPGQRQARSPQPATGGGESAQR
ncbi:MAG: class I SAM-dependent methyltransferase [Candidatus Hydrogenedentes bacterium]|nr:class I SAM-dependent methyltransferase [Candidatus Hydrogenedentota bacterium]